MKSKKILTILLILGSLTIFDCNHSKIVREPIDNSFVVLLKNDNREFVTIYSDLNKITQKDFTNHSIGKEERLDFINKQRKVTSEEFAKLSQMGNVYMVENNPSLDLQKIIEKNTLKNDVLSFLTIPDNQKGLVLKYLYYKGSYVIFKEYRGDYVMIPMNKKAE